MKLYGFRKLRSTSVLLNNIHKYVKKGQICYFRPWEKTFRAIQANPSFDNSLVPFLGSSMQNRNKRPIGLIAPPFKINFLATENWPKIKLKSVRILRKIIHLASGSHIWSFFAQNHMLTKIKIRLIASQITNLASRKSYLLIILPNSYQKLTTSKIRSS